MPMLRGLIASALAALLAVALFAAGLHFWLPRTVHGPVGEGGWTARSRALFTTAGFYGAEVDGSDGHHYAWAGATGEFHFSHLSRSIAYLVRLRLRAGRPADARPELRVSVDGRRVVTTTLGPGDSAVEFEIPRRDAPGAIVALETTPTLIPAPPDPRILGVIVDDVALTPVNGVFGVVSGVWLWLALAVFACAWGVWLGGLRGVPFVIAAAVIAVGFTWLLLKDAAFAGAYVERLVRIGVVAGAIGALVGAIRSRWPVMAGVRDWAVAASLLVAAGAIELAAYWHPFAQVGDAIFQVHRAQFVHAGNYFFTSVTPKPFYEFPYAIALFVTAQPFWNWFPTELDVARLLRALSLVANLLAGLALYGAARRQWPDRPEVLWIAALWPFARAPLEALSNANLTNLFGQGVFGIALAGVAWLAAGASVSWAALIFVAVFLTIAFLSHFGTLTVGLAVLCTVAVIVFVLGRDTLRRVGIWIAVLTIAAASVSWFVYYSHPTFKEVYAKTYASVASRERDDTSKLDAAASVKLQRWWSGQGDDYGLPGAGGSSALAKTAGLIAFATPLAGWLIALRRRPISGATMVMSAWLVAWIALSALGILSAISLRANLATAPAFTFFSALALGAISTRSRAGMWLAIALFAILALDGWQFVVRSLDMPGAR